MGDVIKKIRGREMSSESLPMMEVVEHDGLVYSLSNRRLFVLRVLANMDCVGEIPVAVFDRQSDRVQRRRDGQTKWDRSLSTRNAGQSVVAGRCGVCGVKHQSEFHSLQHVSTR